MAVLSEEDLEKLSQRAISSSLGNSTIDSLQNFCSEFVNRLGPESFQSFISKHEGTLTKLIYTPHYKAYLKSCFKFFKQDIHLLTLLTYCDFRQLNSDSIPKLIREESFDSEHQIEHRSQYYMKVMPKPVWVFDDYSAYYEAPSMKANQFTPIYLSESDIPHLDTDSEPKNVNILKKKEKKPVIDRIMTITQKKSDRVDKSNWVYIQVDMGRDDMLTTQNVLKTLEYIKITSINNIKLFHNNPIVQDADNLEIDNTSKEIETLSKEMDIQKISELAKSSRTSVIKQPGNEDEVLTGELSTNSSEIEKDSRRFNEMIKFASRVNPKNRAYGFVELENYQKKQNALNVYFRLFGIEMDKALLVIEDADLKKTLRVSNLP